MLNRQKNLSLSFNEEETDIKFTTIKLLKERERQIIKSVDTL